MTSLEKYGELSSILQSVQKIPQFQTNAPGKNSLGCGIPGSGPYKYKQVSAPDDLNQTHHVQVSTQQDRDFSICFSVLGISSVAVLVGLALTMMAPLGSC